MSAETVAELQQQRDALKNNIQDVDENIKKLTGRDPAESRRLSTGRRIQLKRNSFGRANGNQPPAKRNPDERRRWGSTALAARTKPLDSGGEEEEEEKKPAIHSSVVATGKPIEVPQRPVVEDTKMKNRNKRMFGLLVGTLKQFKRDSQVKTEQESKREEKLVKVEEQVLKDKEDAFKERKELYQARRDKQHELQKLEFKLEMAELNVELKAHYQKFKGLIQLKSTPRVFYKPAIHNEKTKKLLQETAVSITESLEQRLKEIEMCTDEDIKVTMKSTYVKQNRDQGKSSKDPIVIDPVPSKRDLFAEDADNDQREQETNGKDESNTSVARENTKESERKVCFDAVHEVKEVVPADTKEKSMTESIVVSSEGQDKRHVVSDSSYDVVDERVVELSRETKASEDIADEGKGNLVIENNRATVDDDVNIYEDMPHDIELFQADDVA